MKRSLKICVSLAVLVLCFAPDALSQSAGPTQEETPLCQLNAESVVKGTWFVSLDGWHVAYAMNVAGGQQVVIDGQKGPTYKQVYPPILNDDGSHYMYPAQVAENEWAMIWDGREHGRYSELFENGGWLSPDGRRIVYPAVQNKKLYLVTERGQIAQPSLSTPMCFSRDSQKLVYGAGDGKGGKFLVIDNKPSQTYDDIMSSGPTANWTRFGWVAKKGNETVYLMDTEEVGRGELVTMTLTIDGQELTVDGSKGSVPGLNDEITFTPDGYHYAFCFTKKGKNFLNVDGRVEELDGPATELTFSADGRRIGFATKSLIGQMVVLEDVSGGNRQEFDQGNDIRSLSLSSDGQHAGYIMFLKAGLEPLGVMFYVDDEPVHTGSMILGETSISPDGTRNAVGADTRAVIDGIPGPEYRSLGPGGGSMIPLEALLGGAAGTSTNPLSSICEPSGLGQVFFSPDSRHTAYLACPTKDQWVVVTDDREGERYEGIIQGSFPKFVGTDSLRYLALKGNTIYRVSRTLPR